MIFDLKVYCEIAKPNNEFEDMIRKYYTLSIDRPEKKTKINIRESCNDLFEYDKGESFITYESDNTDKTEVSSHSNSPLSKLGYDEKIPDGEFNTRASFVIKVKDKTQLEYESSSESSVTSEQSSSSM